MKILNVLSSMKTGIVILVIIATLSIVGTLIPQGNPIHWYEHRYNSFLFQIIHRFQLNDMYQSTWFTVLTIALIVNLFLCSVQRLPNIYKKATKPYYLSGKKLVTSMDLNTIKKQFNSVGFTKAKVDGNIVYATKGRMGYLGSWITHLGFMTVILFYFLGKIYGFNTQVSGLPTENIEVDGTNLQVHVEDFLVDYRDDFSVNQYYSYIEVIDGDQRTSGTVSVNSPFQYGNYKFYQIATGWSTKMNIIDSDENTIIRPMYQEDFYFLDEDQTKIVRVVDIRPDFVNNTPFPENPIIIYQLIYNNKIESMFFARPDQPIKWRGDTIIFGNPERYTVLEVVNDPTLTVILFGSILLVLGIFISFYITPRSLAVKPLQDGRYLIYVYSLKDEEVFYSKIQTVIPKGEELSDRKVSI